MAKAFELQPDNSFELKEDDVALVMHGDGRITIVIPRDLGSPIVRNAAVFMTAVYRRTDDREWMQALINSVHDEIRTPDRNKQH